MTDPTPGPILEIVATPPDAAQLAADTIARWIDADVAAGRIVHIALAGGSTPRETYRRLTQAVHEWTNVHLWLADERMVAPESDDANIRMIRHTLIAATTIPPAQVHPVPTAGSPAQAAVAYGASIRTQLPSSPAGVPQFDLVLLGLGEDAHIASLFPDSPGLHLRGTVCCAIEDAPKPPPARVSLTLEVINAAHRRLVLTTGPSKATALAAALGPRNPHVPASLLSHRRTTVIADRAAATQISRR